MKKQKSKLIWLYLGSFLISITPLIIVLVINWGSYTKTPGDTIRLCFGGAIMLFFVFLKAIGKLRMPRRVVLFSIVFVMSYLLQVIVDDLILLSAMALTGEFLDLVCFQRPIKIIKEKILINKTADATTVKVKEEVRKIFEEYKGGRS